MLDEESGTFKYFLKVVPTEYVKLDGESAACFSRNF